MGKVNEAFSLFYDEGSYDFNIIVEVKICCQNPELDKLL